MRHALTMCLLATACVGEPPAEPACRTSDDCAGAACVRGMCRKSPLASGSDAEHPTSPTTGDVDVRPAHRGPCAFVVAVTPQNLVLNEVLANVPTGAGGDANGDGVRDAYEDEFLELVNVSDEPLDLGGVRILVGGKLKHTFEPVCLLPDDAIVVFGGGSIGEAVPGPAVVAQTRLGLPNDGGRIELSGPGGHLAALEYPATAAASLTRVPDVWGADWQSHLEVSDAPFSPGACADASPFAQGCAPPGLAPDPPDAGGD